MYGLIALTVKPRRRYIFLQMLRMGLCVYRKIRTKRSIDAWISVTLVLSIRSLWGSTQCLETVCRCHGHNMVQYGGYLAHCYVGYKNAEMWSYEYTRTSSKMLDNSMFESDFSDISRNTLQSLHHPRTVHIKFMHQRPQ